MSVVRRACMSSRETALKNARTTSNAPARVRRFLELHQPPSRSRSARRDPEECLEDLPQPPSGCLGAEPNEDAVANVGCRWTVQAAEATSAVSSDRAASETAYRARARRGCVE